LIKTIMGRPVTILRAGEATGGKQGTCAVTNPIVSYSPGEAYTFKIKQDGMALFGASSGEVVSSRLGNTFTAGAGCPASTKNPRVGTFCQDNVKSNTYFEVRSLQRRACSRAAVIDADSSGHARQCASRSQVSIVVTHVDVRMQHARVTELLTSRAWPRRHTVRRPVSLQLHAACKCSYYSHL